MENLESFKPFAQSVLKGIPFGSVQAVLSLSQEGGTIPFIARYRKDKTGNMDEVQVKDIIEAYDNFTELEKRKIFVLEEIAKQGALTDPLKKEIESSFDLGEVEELYRPYKKKKKTKAKIAKDAGLEPLANWIWKLGHEDFDDRISLEVKAKDFLNPSAGFATYEEVLKGAQNIIVEKLAGDLDLRKLVRDEYLESAKIKSDPGKDVKKNSKFETYFEYTEECKKLLSPKTSHRYLALRRGWQEGELKVTIFANDEVLLKKFEDFACSNHDSKAAGFLYICAKTALNIHVLPSVTNEIHRKLKETADTDAINVFAENVRKVLMASPFGTKIVLGVDPGLKTGCKLALVDNSGKFISNTVMDILGSKAEEEAKKLLTEVVSKIKIDVIAIGNGTGGREAELFFKKILKEMGHEGLPTIMVNESGASVYSASDIAREEFPDLDLTVRGAISIARRLQDPLSELVKIEPKSIGVGQYQHDVSQTQLKKSLHQVVESCVNQVGVDLNTASSSLLQYVSGIGPALAKNIVKHRNENGLFKNRTDLSNVAQFSSKAFEQSAGFLRVSGGDVLLDKTGIHPERYTAVKDMISEAGLSLKDVIGGDVAPIKKLKEKWTELIGEYTFEDIVSELEKPARDPRDVFKVFSFRDDIHEVGDLKTGMICPGLVTNVTNFGAFVDVGVHQDGLVHISQMTHEFVNDPRLVVAPGDQVKVKVIGVEKDKNQIALSMLLEEKPAVKSNSKSKSKGDKPGKKQFQKGSKGGSKKGHGAKRPGNNKGNKGSGRPQGKPFNNPFASLTGLKDS